jgi:ribosomal protein S18 acetylase RimI-like enzyme
LLRAIEQVEVAVKRIIVSTAENNLPAIALYQKQGYTIAERTILPDGLVLVDLQKQIVSNERS